MCGSFHGSAKESFCFSPLDVVLIYNQNQPELLFSIFPHLIIAMATNTSHYLMDNSKKIVADLILASLSDLSIAVRLQRE